MIIHCLGLSESYRSTGFIYLAGSLFQPQYRLDVTLHGVQLICSNQAQFVCFNTRQPNSGIPYDADATL